MKYVVAFIAGAVSVPVVALTWAWRGIGPENREKYKTDLRRAWSAENAKSDAEPSAKIDPESYVSSVTYEARKEQEVVDWIVENWNGATSETAWKLFSTLNLSVGDRLQVDFESGVRLIKA